MKKEPERLGKANITPSKLIMLEALNSIIMLLRKGQLF